MPEDVELDNSQIEKWQSPRERLNNAIKLMERNGTDDLTLGSYKVIVDLIGSRPPGGEIRTEPTPRSKRMTEFIERQRGGAFGYLAERERYLQMFELSPGFTIYLLPQIQFSPDPNPVIILSSTEELGKDWLILRDKGPYANARLERDLFVDTPTPWDDEWGVIDGRLDGESNLTRGNVFIVPGTEQRPGNIFTLNFFNFNPTLKLEEQDFESLGRSLTDELKCRVRDSYATAFVHARGEDVFSQFQIRKLPRQFPRPRKIEYPKKGGSLDIEYLLYYIRRGIVERKKDRFNKLRGIGKRLGISGQKPPAKLLESSKE